MALMDIISSIKSNGMPPISSASTDASTACFTFNDYKNLVFNIKRIEWFFQKILHKNFMTLLLFHLTSFSINTINFNFV